MADFASDGQEESRPLHDTQQEKEREREAILDVPVKITAVVGDVKMPVRDLVRLGRGAVVPLNRKLGSSIDIYANDRLIARGEITIIEDDNIAVTMTEIMSSSAST
ncbi:flagellar motor switch protein FliN [Bombella intestini]|uniref:Flagellar motor switch protein FliN n=1 Tax=Bombella intestini TaxID=1539051 RepID=A0A1S8GQA2_9PROT|nr:flagellar motor switch protein FliN [Bombella intestini]